MSKDSTDLVPFNQLKADVETFVAPTKEIVVSSFETSSKAIEVVKEVKAYSKKVDDLRKLLVAPLNGRVKVINDFAKTILQPLEDAEASIKKKLVAFDMEQAKLRAEAQRKADEEFRKKQAELQARQEEERIKVEARLKREAQAAAMFGSSDEAAAPEESPEAKLEAFEAKQIAEQAILENEKKAREFDIRQQGIKGVTKRWACEIVDIDQVPKEYLIRELNRAMILAAARTAPADQPLQIPGVRIWQEAGLAVGSNTYVPRAALQAEG